MSSQSSAAKSPPSQNTSLAVIHHSENVEEELNRVRMALDAVYSGQDVQLADRYVTSFQATQVAWIVCDRLLQDDNPRRQFFAAQTLHTKCRTDIAQLPTESLPSLRDSLLQHLHRNIHSESALTTRLALGISALAVQMEWTTIVNDLILDPAALLIFRVLPEECASDRLLLLDESARFRMRDHLISSASQVFQCFQSLKDTTKVMEAFHTWIRYVPVAPQSLLESPLLPASVQALCQGHYLEHAADILVEVLRMYPSHHPGNHGLVHAMIPLLSQLPLQQALHSDDEDVLRSYCRVVTEMGESYMSLLLEQQAGELVDWILLCSAMADTEIAGITLHFWYRFILDLEAQPYDRRQELVDYYQPQILRLVDICVTSLMRYPSELDDNMDDIHRHRFYVAETMEDCCRLLGGQCVVQRLLVLTRDEVDRRQQWQGIESCLACITAIQRFVPSDESELLPLCFSLIPQLHIGPLRFTACKMIGKFASWLALHVDLVQPLHRYLAEGLLIPDCAPAAAVAIKELCECSNQNDAIAEPVMHLYEQITGKANALALADELQILEGLCRAFRRQMEGTQESGMDFLTRLAQPICERLAASDSARQAIPEIERLTTILQYLFDPETSPSTQPIIELMSKTWALLDAIMKRCPQDTLLAEKICRLHKHALRSAGKNAYAPVLDALIQQLVSSFEITRQSPFLYAASICVTEYGADSAYSKKLFDMVAAMATTVFTFLRTLLDFTNHPDVVEEFFYLMGRMMSYCPEPLVLSSLLSSLVQCSAIGMQLDHHGANKGTIRFIESTISYGLSLREDDKPKCQASLERVLTQEGQAIVSNLARALVGEIPSYSNQIPEILWKLNLLCPELLARWLTAAFESVALPERAKNDFMGALDIGLAKEDFTLAARAFQSACERDRRFHRTRSK